MGWPFGKRFGCGEVVAHTQCLRWVSDVPQYIKLLKTHFSVRLLN